MSYTLITGATGYLGRAFALECLFRGEKLYLTGRSEEKLACLKNYLLSVKPDAEILTFPCDLTDTQERKKLFDNAGGYTFSRLINVAGADVQKAFELYDEDKLTFQARVCFEAAVSLCNFCIRRRADRLNIINISSVSGIYPMPYFALYSATKSALTYFSLALSVESKEKGITITAVLPGSIYTRPDVSEYIKSLGLWGRISAKPPHYVATKALDASDKGRKKIIVGGANKFMNAATKLIPLNLKMRFIAKKWSGTQKDAF
ncbi:MAG: SDR family NAD(P)-dependent oxidoreductase [Candidatus Coproplasma sp.]